MSVAAAVSVLAEDASRTIASVCIGTPGSNSPKASRNTTRSSSATKPTALPMRPPSTASLSRAATLSGAPPVPSAMGAGPGHPSASALAIHTARRPGGAKVRFKGRIRLLGRSKGQVGLSRRTARGASRSLPIGHHPGIWLDPGELHDPVDLPGCSTVG